MKKLLNYLLYFSLFLTVIPKIVFGQSMYIKNDSGCPVEVMLRGHASGPSPYNTSCVLLSTVFTVGGTGDITFSDVPSLDCSSCTPGWSGAPYSLTGTAPFSGSEWDGAYIRAFCTSPPSCSPWNTLGPCFSTTTISVPGCTSVNADWVYDSVNDLWEIAIY